MNDNPQPKRLNPTEALHEALTHTQPEARPEFRRALEDQLAARIMSNTPAPSPLAQSADERTIVMTMTTAPDMTVHLNGHESYPAHESAPESDMPSIETLTDVSHFRRFTLPLTLVAALMIGMLIFPTLMSMRDKNGNIGANPPAFGVNPEVTVEATETPTSTTPIVVAARAIIRGRVLNATDVELREWPTEHVPVNAITDLEWVYNQIARIDIYNGQPLLTTTITKELPALIGVGPDAFPAPPPTIEIVVASRHISRGEQITDDDVKLVVWEERYMPMSAIFNPSEVIGQFARTDIFRESPILETVLGASPADADGVSEPLPSHLTVEVIVAVQPVAAGTILSKEMVAMRLYPRFAMPPGTFTDTDEVIGKRAMTDLHREMPIIDTQIGIAYRTYTLEEGDHPSLIADRFGVSFEDILELNNLDASSSLLMQVGDTLLLPPDENSGASTAAGGGFSVAQTLIAIPFSRLTNETQATDNTISLVGFSLGSDIAIIRNRPETGIPSTRMTVIVPAARLIANGIPDANDVYASFIVSNREAEALNSIISYSDDLFTLYPIPETQPESAPVVIVITPTPAPSTSAESREILLPPGMRMIALPFDRLDSVAYAIQEGDYIDILYTRPGSDEPITVVEAALVVHVGPIPADDSIGGNETVAVTPDTSQDSQGDIIAVAVSPRTAVALQSMAKESLRFVLRPAGQAAEAKTQQTFDLPLDLITNSEILPQVFEFVDVYATLWYLDVDGEFQRVAPETEGATRMTQVVVRDAQVTAVDEDAITVTLLVSDEEAGTLSWVIGGRAPLILVASSANPDHLYERMMTPIVVTATPAPTAMPDSARILLPPGTRMVAMPLDGVMNMGNAIRAGDLIEIVRPNLDADEPITVVQAARVVYVGEFPSDDFIMGIDRVIGTPEASEGLRPEIVAFAVSPEEAETLSALLDSDPPTPLTLRPRPFAQAEREGMVDLSLDLIANDETLPRIGDVVDVYATLLFINIDDEFQRIVPETESALKATQLVARNAFVVVVDKEANLIRLSVTEQEKTILGNAAIWHAPITLMPARPFGYGSSFTVTPMPTPQPEAHVKIREIAGVGDIASEATLLVNEGLLVDVTGWTLSDEHGHIFTLSEMSLFAGSSLVVMTGAGMDTPIVKFWNVHESVWQPGETATLRDQFGNVVSTYTIPQDEVQSSQPVLSITPMMTPAAQSEATRTPLETLLDGLDVPPAGYSGLLVPMDRLLNPAIALNVGERVHVFVTFLFVDMDEEHQTILNPAADTVEGEDARLMHQKVVTDAHVLGIFRDEYNLIALALKPEDMVTLTYLIESRTPLMILPETLGQMASEMTSVEGGTFEMGEVADCGYCQPAPDNDPAQEITVDDFVIDDTEVSNAQYANYLNWLGRAPEIGCGVDGVLHPCITGTDDPTAPIQYAGEGIYHPNETTREDPVTQVTWHGADAYCRALGRRLPTEAEWEYAHRQTDEAESGSERVGFRCAVGAD